MKKLLTAVLGVVFLAFMCGTGSAGDLTPSGAPSGGSGMPSLQDIYDYLNAGTPAPTPGAFMEPAVGPAPTMKTLGEIYEDIKAQFDQCEIYPGDVTAGKKYFSTIPGWWGVRIGGTPIPVPSATATPTTAAISTPTSTPDWYTQYGPSGTGDVVQIGSMYVASRLEGIGCAGGITYQWQAANDWAAALDWLPNGEQWRLPTMQEFPIICDNKASLASGRTELYWSSEYIGGMMEEAYGFRLSDCHILWDWHGDLHNVRAVRSVE